MSSTTKPQSRAQLAACLILAAMSHAIDLGAQDAPTFASIQVQTNREAKLRLNAPKGYSYRLEASQDVTAWTPLVTLRTNSALIDWLESGAPMHSERFYRAVQSTNTSLITGDHLATSDGEVVIHPINHATLVLGWKSTIYVDPTGGASLFTGLPRADLILITHEHSDHWDSATLTGVLGANTIIIATSTVYNQLTSALKALTTKMANGASTNLIDMSVDAVPAYNLTASNHPKGVGNGYIITIGGKRIYIGGDTDNTPEMLALQGIDVAFVPMRPPYTMGVSQAAAAVRAFRPQVVYPYHYSGQDVGSFKRQVGYDLGIETRLRKWY